jgi:hypothetical protein
MNATLSLLLTQIEDALESVQKLSLQPLTHLFKHGGSMKQDTFRFGLFLFAALMAAILFAPATSLAQDVTTPLPDPEASLINTNLLVLPMDILDPESIPAGMSPEQSAEYAQQLTYEMAQPLLAKLRRMQAEGAITNFTVRADLHSLMVTGVSEQGIDELSNLQQASTVIPYGDKAPSCAGAAARALSEQVFGLSQISIQQAQRRQVAAAGLQVTDPTIEIYAPFEGAWSYISGQTAPNTALTLRVARGGREIGTSSTISNNDGQYRFFPSWDPCSTSGYSWTLKPGDVVEVTANGKTVSTIVANLSAWVDPVANTVAGKTDPGRAIEVVLNVFSNSECSDPKLYTQNASVAGNGNFSANMGGQVDFNRRTSAYIYARDANGNSTSAWYFAYRIVASLNNRNFSGYLKPDANFSASLSRGGNVLSTFDGTSSADNYFYGEFDTELQPGDRIKIVSGDILIETTVAPVNLMLDPVSDRMVGVTAPGHQVAARFYKNDSSWGIPSTCSSDYHCGVTTADANGNFEVAATLDLARGDYAYFYTYDGEGNPQLSGQRYVPTIMASLTWGQIQGYWGDLVTSSVTVILKDSNGAVKWSDPSLQVSSWNGEFLAYVSAPLLPTDSIEVGNGVYTETMTIQSLTAQLGGDKGDLRGTGYNGRLLASLLDFRREGGFYSYRCAETKVTNGAYTLTFGDAKVGAQDSATVWNIGPDGHYTMRYVYAFSVNVNKGGNYVWGYSKKPDTEILITLWRNGELQAAHSMTSSNKGYFSAYLNSGTSDTVMQGDILQVQTADGDDISLLIPELSVAIDTVNDRIYGKAPANQVVHLQSLRHVNWGGFYSTQTVTTDSSGNYNAPFDSSGNYSTSFNDLFLSFGCTTVELDHRCTQANVIYYSAGDHRVQIEGPRPQPVGADSYEGDNTSATAHTYTGIRSHTFHESDDVDWVSFTIPASDILKGVVYRIETLNLGWNMATRVEIHSSRMEFLGAWTGYEQNGRGVSAVWKPSSSGVYYLRISPPDPVYSAYCDARYDLLILPVRGQVFLPAIGRNH